jgi:hypothetical protein
VLLKELSPLGTKKKMAQSANTAVSVLLLLLCLTNTMTFPGEAYRVTNGNNLSETETCNQFVTKLGANGYQMRALPASGDDSSSTGNETDWLTASDVERICGTTLSLDGGFEMFMTKYPQSVKYWFEFPAVRQVNENYRFTALGSWGDLTDTVRAECDYEGNAYFVAPNGFAGTGDFVPQAVSSMDWNTTQAKTFEGSFTLDLKNKDQDADPLFGEGFIISAALCRIRPPSGTPTQKLWPSRNYLYSVVFSAEIRHWWGLLHPEMWSELILLAVIAFPKALLVIWFAYKCRTFSDHVMSQQRYFLFISIFSFFSSFAYLMFLVGANASGIDTCCPTPASSAFFLGVKVMSNMTFNLLVLATAKGWGVVTPRLDPQDQRKIVLFFTLSVILYAASRIFKPSLQMAYLLVFNDTVIWLWIFLCLRQTKTDLSLSSRVDRHAKLDMYTKLHRLLLLGLGLWCAIVTIEVWVILLVYNREGRIII